MNKYKNIPITIDGIRFDSKKEGIRYYELRMLEKAGKIANLEMQVPFELIPAQKNTLGKTVRPLKYIADFVYIENGKKIVEDVKGVKTREFEIKRKLMLHIHGIDIRIV